MLRCAACGGALEPRFRFCPQCGQAVTSTTPKPAPAPAPLTQAPQAAIAGERKQVTVLFCDLVGSTAIAERLDPEEYRDIIERYLERVFPEIARFGGIVNTLAGDGLMALFGAPVAHGDDPRRAVRAALAIRETLGRLGDAVREERGITLRARIGVHSGPVVVGTVGTSFKMDYTAIGDTTNLAARLQTLANPGSILISEATHRLVRGFFVVEPTGPLDVKGKSDPVTAYEVVARAATTSPMIRAAERGLTPLVGREAELARLEVAYGRLAHRALQVVAILGEAGIGKSRLVYEFRQRLGDRPATFFEGRCSSMNQAVPFYPILSMLRNYFELATDDSPDAARAKLAAKVGVHYSHIEDMFPLLSRFLSLPSSHVDAPGDDFKREVFDAVAELLLGESHRGPVVVVMEDLHWIDESSRELLEVLLKRIASARVLVVVTQRPDAEPRWQVTGGVEKLHLARLSADELTEIVRAVAGAPLPAELEPLVVAKAAGSPFFAEELVRGLVEEGHLVKNGQGLRLAGPVAEIPIPSTIHEVVAARLDRLGPQAKRVVQVAAVFGRQFTRTHLADVLADEPIDVALVLEELVRRGVFHAKTAIGSDDLRFGESLTQEIAYEGLLLRQRRQLHERVARYLDGQPGSGPARSALLAHHWSRTEQRGHAADALMQAARDAESVPSYGVAVDLYRRAWDAAEAANAELQDERFLRMALDATAALTRLVVYFGLPFLDEAARAAERGRELAERFHDANALVSFLYMLGVMTMTRDGRQFASGLALAERGLEIAEEKGLRLAAARIVRGICINYAVDGRFEEARRKLDPMLAAMEANEDPAKPGDLYLSARWVKDVVLYASDALDEARAHIAETLALGARVNNRTVRCAGSAILAQVHCLRGEYEQALALADESLTIGEEIGNLNVFPAAASVALIARVELGVPVEPGPYVESIEKGLAAAGFMQLNVRFVTEALLAIGDLGRAEAHAEALYGVVGGRLRQALVGVAFGDVMTRLGRLDRALEAYVDAQATAEEIGARSALVGAILGQATIAIEHGLAPDHRAVARALAIADELGLARYRRRLARVPAPAAAVLTA
jgi:class 3 adenylate cyclase/tetratricopeptide (TPR) repeat protein